MVRNSGVNNVLQGGGPRGDAFRIIFIGPVRSNVKDGVRVTHRVSAIYHREAGVEETRRDMGNTGSRGSSGGSGDSVGGHLNWPQGGDGTPVGDAVPSF